MILVEVGMVSEWQQLKDGGMCRDREKENDVSPVPYFSKAVG